MTERNVPRLLAGAVAIALLTAWLWSARSQPRVTIPVNPKVFEPKEESNSNPRISTDSDLREAEEKLRAGDAIAGIRQMRDAVARVEKLTGTDSPPHAAALYNLGCVYTAAGDLQNAATCMESACRVKPTDHQAKKDRLTYQINFGDILVRLGRFEDAEKVLRNSLEERSSFYGEEHAGYAYGLKPLAEMLLVLGRQKEALPLITRARDICLKSPTPLTPNTFASRMYVVKATGGKDAAAWERMDELSGEERKEVYLIAMALSEGFHGSYVPDTLSMLYSRSKDEPALTREDRWELGATLLIATQREKDLGRWLQVAELLLQEAERQSDRTRIVAFLQSIALAHDRRGDAAKTEEVYADALKRAVSFADSLLISAVHRNYGLFLSEQNKKEQAEKHLCASLDSARQAKDTDTLAAALTAYGIFVQHAGDLSRGRVLLEEAVSLMQPTNRNFLYAQNHLNAIRNNASCGCGDMTTAFGDAIMRMVRGKLPEGLVSDITVTLKPGGKPDIAIKMARKPTAEEAKQVDTVVNQAVIELQESIRRNNL